MQIFFKSCNLNFSLCFKAYSIHGFVVVLTTRRNLSIALLSLIWIVPRSTTKGAVYHHFNLLELIFGSTSSRVATDYHWHAYLYFDPWWSVVTTVFCCTVPAMERQNLAFCQILYTTFEHECRAFNVVASVRNHIWTWTILDSSWPEYDRF